MTDVAFHRTRMGHTFYEHTLPELVRQITRLNDLLERLVEKEHRTHDDRDEQPTEDPR
jgi:hypothetical protein